LIASSDEVEDEDEDEDEEEEEEEEEEEVGTISDLRRAVM
jgi:hypothetical protein